jgi:murein DD-endopeptidase MepM/ murein hydrolase activator NlpD
MLTAMSGSRFATCTVLVVALALAQGLPAMTDASAAAPRWRWPTAPPSRVVQGFEAPAGPYAAGHRGIDVAAAPGTPVLAPAAAVVQFSGTVAGRPVVTLHVDEHVLVSFEPVAGEVPVGAAVAAGQRFGAVASGGHCDGRCVHVGVRVDGEYVSPLLFFAGVPPAVLLPLG